MSLFRPLLSRRNALLPSFLTRRTLSSSSAPQPTATEETEKSNGPKPIRLLFQEVVGLRERTDTSESDSDCEKSKLKKELREFERKLTNLRMNPKGDEKEKQIVKQSKKPEKAKSLSELFEKKVVKRRVKKDVYEELSTNVELFVKYLYNRGYFKNANFFRDNKFDFGYFDNSYAREYIKHAAMELGRANQDVAKWLSGSQLKKIALFGCPSTDKKNVFAAKRLRKFFKVEENIVCSACMLKDSCRFKNQGVWKNVNKNLRLEDVMRVASLYALDLASTDLIVPDEIKQSAALLLKETIKLSEDTT